MKSCRQQHTSNTSSTTSVTWQRCSVERVWLFSNQELNSWCHKAAQTSFLWPQPKWTSWLCRWRSEVMWKSYGLPHPEAFFFFFCSVFAKHEQCLILLLSGVQMVLELQTVEVSDVLSPHTQSTSLSLSLPPQTRPLTVTMCVLLWYVILCDLE